MYGWIWQRLPGGTSGKAVSMAVLVLGALALLWLLVFPWAAVHVPIDQAGVGG
jgi:hypothetical protein